MPAEDTPRPAADPGPPPAPATERDWDEWLWVSFGPRYWIVGCG